MFIEVLTLFFVLTHHRRFHLVLWLKYGIRGPKSMFGPLRGLSNTVHVRIFDLRLIEPNIKPNPPNSELGCEFTV